MPISKDNFPQQIAKTAKANRACLETMGAALLQVATPLTPKLTGHLQRSHTSKLSGSAIFVGVTAEYGGYVHNGTSRMKARPWLRIAAVANKNAIAKAGESAWAQVMNS